MMNEARLTDCDGPPPLDWAEIGRLVRRETLHAVSLHFHAEADAQLTTRDTLMAPDHPEGLA